MDKTLAETRFGQLSFPRALREIHEGAFDPFEFELRNPHYIFSSDAPDISETLVPLMESGPFTYFYDESDGSYLAFHLESPNDVHYFGRSVQCLWAAIFLSQFDDETTLLQIQTIAQKIGFLFADFLFEKMRAYIDGDTTYDDARKSILQHCERN